MQDSNNVTVIIPAYNEEKNILSIIKNIKNENNVQEIIVVDNNSTDRTSELARKAGAIVTFCKEQGKGYAMKKGLEFAKNSIVAYVDADINDYEKGFIDKIVEPIKNNEVDFIKTAFDRKCGRVTELVAKPLLELLMPNMCEFVQPLSGIIASRKSILDDIEFETDYGVDIGILLDVINLGVRVKQMNIGRLNNDSHDWKDLTGMSKQVMRAILKRAN